ncbi:hypothetical protein ACN4EK_01010 [Pantanalinema rosaneae CENA516]|uniref:hypothetical protein n=1 Tax=Pantanalinema rosaneae TaxID=1620701 RepID=UPI003D700596
MTPDAIRTLSNLRQASYSLFATAMDSPVRITNRNSQAGNLSIASWVDSQQQVNYLCIVAHTAPDEFIPERPFVLRLMINRGGDFAGVSRQRKAGQEMNQSWGLELVLLPEEVLDFVPWLVNLVQFYDSGKATSLPAPPHPLEHELSLHQAFHRISTQPAIAKLTQQPSVEPAPIPCLSFLQKR